MTKDQSVFTITAADQQRRINAENMFNITPPPKRIHFIIELLLIILTHRDLQDPYGNQPAHDGGYQREREIVSECNHDNNFLQVLQNQTPW